MSSIFSVPNTSLVLRCTTSLIHNPQVGSIQFTIFLQTDVQFAALVNGMASHIDDHDDTQLETNVHLAGPVTSAPFAFTEWKVPVSRPEFVTTFVTGVEVKCLSAYLDHYVVGWHITTDSVGVAVGETAKPRRPNDAADHWGRTDTHMKRFKLTYILMTTSTDNNTFAEPGDSPFRDYLTSSTSRQWPHPIPNIYFNVAKSLGFHVMTFNSSQGATNSSNSISFLRWNNRNSTIRMQTFGILPLGLFQRRIIHLSYKILNARISLGVISEVSILNQGQAILTLMIDAPTKKP